MNQNTDRETFPILFFMKTLLFEYIITGVLLLVLAFLLFRLGLDEKMVSIAIIAIYVISTVLGGLITGKRMGNRRFMWGLLMGCAYFLLLTLVSLFAGEEGVSVGNSFWTTLILCAGGGMLGGMIS